MKETNIVLNNEQSKIYNALENSRDNILIHGKAGTGKSELLKYLVKNTKKKAVVLAPTGIAAMNVGGQTIHSLFRLKFGVQIVSELKEVNEKLEKILRTIDTIIIDEISMVSPDVIDMIDVICKIARGNLSFFGGIQLIAFGDLYQLPPIISNYNVKRYLESQYDGLFFYNAHAFENKNLLEDNSLKVFELTHIFRQTDDNYKCLLNKIRNGSITQNEIDILNERVISEDLEEDVITISTRNDIVNSINRNKLNRLPGKEYIFKADITGDVKESYFPTDEELHLKIGAQIMMVVNDQYKRWVNGSYGIITEFKPNKIKVKIDDKEYYVEKNEWTNSKYIYENGTFKQVDVGVFKQYPIRLAWATTVHKAQGKTFQSILVDLGDGAFDDGQLYVALSRCPSLNTLHLKTPIKLSDIKVNQEVVNFMENAKVVKMGEEV